VTLKVSLIDFKVEIHDVCVKNENWCETRIETTRIFHNFIHYVVRSEWLIHKIKDFLLYKFVFNQIVKDQKNIVPIFSMLLSKD